ncbi:MAG: hypothetical protein ACREE6_12335 [Limisphaerales bacterium]
MIRRIQLFFLAVVALALLALSATIVADWRASAQGVGPYVHNSGVGVTPMQLPQAALQNNYVFIGDSRLSSNPDVGTNVWPLFFAAGHEPCVVENYAYPGITASNIWVGWNTNGGQFQYPGHPYTAFVAAGVNDVGLSYNTSITESNITFKALTNIWYWERKNGASPVVAFTVAPNFSDLGNANYFNNWTNLNTLILGANVTNANTPWGWDVCVNEGTLLNVKDMGNDELHQSGEGVLKEVGLVNAALHNLNGLYYPDGDFLNATGPYFPDEIVTNGCIYVNGSAVPGESGSYGSLTLGLSTGGNAIYTYAAVSSWHDDGQGWAFVNGSIDTVTIPHGGGVGIGEISSKPGAVSSTGFLWTSNDGALWYSGPSHDTKVAIP